MAVTIVGLHLASVTLEALPPNRYSEAVQDQTAYVDPYFNQNWRLFAPNPIAEDRSLLFQGAYVDADGKPARTPWIDWTAVELDLVHHRLIGGRAGYVTNKLVSPLLSRAAALTSAQRLIVTGTSQAAPSSFGELTSELEAADTPLTAMFGFLRYDRAAIRLGSDVVAARYPTIDFTAVRYSVRLRPVVPYEARDESAVIRDASRPPQTDAIGGWRRPGPGPSAERAAVRDFDRAHR